jgi:hypothetical protein
MGKRYQCFVAPGDDDLPLPIPKTRWHVERSTYIPAEHWEFLVQYAQEHLGEEAQLMEEASYLNGDYSHWSKEKSVQFRQVLERLCSLLGIVKDLMFKDSDELYYENSEYIKMLQAVIAVVDESLKASEFFDAYVDS